MVVQCDSCQSKFRIADEKVTDRGVRVRCTSCKNVFQVRKSGAGGSEGTPGPGSTMDLSSLGAAAIARSNGAGKPAAAARPGTGPVKPSTGPVKPSTGPVKPSTGPLKPKTGPVKPKTGPVRPAGSRPGEGSADARLDVDDLFGMAELTGDAPLSAGLDPTLPPPPAPAPAAPPAKPAQARTQELIDLEFDLDDAKTARPPPPPPEAATAAARESLDPPMSSIAAAAPADIALQDPFAEPSLSGGNLASPKSVADEPPPREPRPKSEPVQRPSARPRSADTEIAPLRAIVASALTGVLGAALAMVVVVVSSLSDDAGGGWFGFGRSAEVVATGVVSGMYDTAGGKPVFYVRGRVENRTGKTRGPVRVTAELIADGSPEAKAEAIAGAEPTPEDVWSVRSPADADRLNRSLQSARVERKVAPGASLPFFAMISEPPPDLVKHRLQIRIETVDAWTPSAAKAARDK